MSSAQVHESLRQWARGIYPLEAAVELLVRAHAGRFAREGWEWIETHENRFTLNAERITEDTTGVLSGGERRLLHIAAALAGAAPANLYEDVPGLDRHTLDLVLAAISHAAGSHDDHEKGILVDINKPVALHPWPQEHT